MGVFVGLISVVLLILGPILFFIGSSNGDSALQVWGVGLAGFALLVIAVQAGLNKVERNAIAVRAVRGLGSPPPPRVQKQLWNRAQAGTLDGSAPSNSVIENYETLCRLWAERASGAR